MGLLKIFSRCGQGPAQNRRGLRAIRPQISQNSPREQFFVNGKMYVRGLLFVESFQNCPRQQKSILSPGCGGYELLRQATKVF